MCRGGVPTALTLEDHTQIEYLISTAYVPEALHRVPVEPSGRRDRLRSEVALCAAKDAHQLSATVNPEPSPCFVSRAEDEPGSALLARPSIVHSEESPGGWHTP